MDSCAFSTLFEKNPTKSIENLNSFILKAKIETKVSYLSDTKL